MRIYLVVVDDSPEAGIALRFAARRAAKTGGGVEILSVLPPSEFVAFGGVQATMEEEERQKAEALMASAAGAILEESGLRPAITLKQGDAPRIIREHLAANAEIAALVLGASAAGVPGPLVAHFAADAAALPVPLMIVPGGLTPEAIDRLS